MPFTYSIADGLIGGICLYITINTLVWLIEKASRGRIVPPNKAEKDPWSWRVRGGILPSWIMRIYTGRQIFPQDDTPITESILHVPKEKMNTNSDDFKRDHPESPELRDQEKAT